MADQKLLIDDELAPYFTNWGSGRELSDAQKKFQGYDRSQQQTNADDQGMRDYGAQLEAMGQGNFRDRTPVPPPAAPQFDINSIVADAAPAPRPAVPQPKPLMTLADNGDLSRLVQGHIAAKSGFGPDLDANALKDAQEQARGNQLAAALGGAANTIGNSIARQPGKTDNSAFQAMAKDANRPVDELQARRAATVQDIHTKSLMEESDPNSQMSMALKRAYAPILKANGLSSEAIASASAADLKNFFQQPMEAIAKIRAHKDEMAQKYSEMGLRREELKATKETTAQNQAFQQTAQALESMRGNPAAQQAEKDLYAAGKLDDILAKAHQSPQMVQIAATEMAKMAGGGAPTHEELKGLLVPTSDSAFARLAQYVQNHPVSAEADEFLKQYGDYAHDIRNRAQSVIGDRYGRILETRKGMLAPQHYEALRHQYIDRFGGSREAASGGGNRAGAAAPGAIVNIKGKGRFRVGADGDSLEAI